MGFDWSQFRGSSGESYKFDNVGDAAIGTVVNIRVHVFMKDNGKEDPTPILTLRQDDGAERDLVASWVDLKPKLYAADPQVNDKIAVVFTHADRIQGRPQPMKRFDVKVQKASLSQVAGAAVPTATAAPTAGVSAADLLG